MILIELPLLAVQAVVWAVQAVVTLGYKTVRGRPWTITAASEYPKPVHVAQAVVGWRASRARVHAIATELESGLEPPPAPSGPR